MPKYIASVALLLFGLLLTISAYLSFISNRSPNIKVQFVNSRVGWIVGPRLLKTTDGGKTWTEIRHEDFGTFEGEYIGYGHRSLQFVDSATGVQLGGNVIAKSTDGGRTWTENLSIPKPADQDMPPQSLFFISPKVGWVVGEYVYGTNDVGRSWLALSRAPIGNDQRQRSMRIAPSYANYMPALWFSDAQNGLMARLDGEVYATTDGGKTWEKRWSVEKSITDMFFISAQDGWIVGNEGLVGITNDAGRTWTSIPPPTKANLTSVFFVNKLAGCAVGYGGEILYTKDGGVTWKRASITGLWTPSPLASVSFADELHGWSVGGNSDPFQPSLLSPSNVILATEDGGQSWKLVKL
ncbi:MAG: YCF48-related protein [Pyrinomonadaceae bacterium]